MNLRLRVSQSSPIHILNQSLGLLEKSDKRKIFIVVFVQILLGLLDLAGVILLGVIGSITVGGVGSRPPGDRISSFLQLLSLDDASLTKQVVTLGVFAVVILVGKTLMSLYLTRRILFFLARQGARLSSQIVMRFLNKPLLRIQSTSIHETAYAVTSGMNVVTVGIIGASIFLASDASLLLILGISLLLIDPMIALSTTLMFGIVGLVLYLVLSKRAVRLGRAQAKVSIKSQELIIQVLTSYREIFVKGRRKYFGEKISETRFQLADSTAETAFLQNISKFALEITVVVGTISIAGIQFAIHTGAHAIAVLSIFLAATTRIAPAVMRIQQGLIQIRGNVGSASPTLELIRELRNENKVDDSISTDSASINFFDNTGFVPEIELSNVSFRYPDSDSEMLSGATLKIEAGSLNAFVGESGAGKTTLADLILGLLEPESGKISLAGLRPIEAIQKWPGAVAYVPQDVVIFNGSIRENITLGFENLDESEAQLDKVVNLASLSDFIGELPEGLDSQVGDRGTSLSGGQRQRIGIARALYTNPRLLVMDEATSSLDGVTESIVSGNISKLHGEVTVILIAHRLSTVRNANSVIYLQKGQIHAIGSFEEVRRQIPDFDTQAKLMGL
jgi:ATP-binding cassette, subfamily B, bacterial PglK